jgi:hypothetical protein
VRLPVPGGLLHVFELGAVLKRGGDEGRAHRVRRVAAIEPELLGEEGLFKQLKKKLMERALGAECRGCAVRFFGAGYMRQRQLLLFQ